MISVALLVVAFPTFHAKFVPTQFTGRNVELWDATKQLSAVGESYARMIDSQPGSQLFVYRGRDLPAPRFWPVTITDAGRFRAKVGQFSRDDNPVMQSYRFGRIVGDKLRLQEASGPTLPHSHLAPIGYPQISRWSNSWWPNSTPAKNRDIDGDHVSSHAWVMPSWTVVNVNFFPVTPGYETCMHDADRYVPLVEVNGKTRKLEDCLTGDKLTDLGQVVWVDAKGWMIAVCDQNEKEGLVWLYPVTK